MMSRLSRLAILAGAWGFLASPAAADTWNERTILTFSAPVMVPGATLTPGTYVFDLVNPDTSQHTVRIRREGGDQIAVVRAVPLKRDDAKSDIVLRFDPTDAGTPPALRAFFYPGSLYGHEFVYPGDQAREIAKRTRALVLATDQPDSDAQAATLRVYDATGSREWRGDAVTLREWEAWRQQRQAAAERRDQTPGTPPLAEGVTRPIERPGMTEARQEARQESRQESSDRTPATASATVVSTTGQGRRIDLDDLENAPASFIGQTISVDAEVEDVYGPRLFTIDEPNWADLDGEVLVHVPSALAALVNEGDRVTVTGTIERLQTATLEREWGWMGFDPGVSMETTDEPVLVATQIVGGDDNVALLINAGQGTAQVAGSRQMAPEVTSVAALAIAGDDLVGRRVKLDDVTLHPLAAHGGYYVQSPEAAVLVLPPAESADVDAGARVTIEGVVLKAPRDMRLTGDVADNHNEDIYVLATAVDSR